MRNAWRIQKTITCLVQTGTDGHGQAQQEISIMEIVDQFEHYSVFQCLICTIEIILFIPVAEVDGRCITKDMTIR